MFINILLVSLGGATGAVLRFSVSPQIDKLFSSSFPYGIFLVNIIGCFLIGLLGNKFSDNESLRLLFIVGFLGSLTTFSTFAFDNYNLLNLRSYYYLFTNLILSNFIGIIMVFIGTRTIRLFS
tara:strand:+ start:615 stop:983 length:369 start_codon:yes stop_codon:yes gene_type:complete